MTKQKQDWLLVINVIVCSFLLCLVRNFEFWI